MADQAAVLRDFLVRLGFKIDTASQSRFTAGVAATTKAVARLGAAAIAAAVTVAAATAKMTGALDDLYYASRRTGASANNIKAFGYAVSQMGGDADSAAASLEAFARNLRSSPGYFGMLEKLGVQAKDAGGNLRDTVDVLGDVGKRLAAMPYYQANAYAQALGIDERTLMAMREGVGEFSDEYRRILAATGTDLDKSAKDANQAMRTWRTFSAVSGLVLSRLGKAILSALQPAMSWFNNNAGKIIQVFGMLGRLARRAGELLGSLGDAIADLGKWLDSIDPKLKWFLGALALIAGAVMAPKLALVALGVALLALYDDFKTFKEGGAAELPWADWAKQVDRLADSIKALANMLGDKLAEAWRKAKKAGEDFFNWAKSMVSKETAGKAVAAATGSAPAQASTRPSAPAAKPSAPAAKPSAPAGSAATAPSASGPAVNELGQFAQSAYGQLLAKGEGSRYGYDAYNAGTKGTPIKINSKGEKYQSVVHGGSYKAATGRAITDMTIGEILSAGQGTGMDKARIYVAGKYQFATETLRGLVKAEGIPLSTKFTPEVQDMLFAAHLKRRAPSVYAYATGKSDSYTAKDWNTVAAEWRSMPDTSGKTYQDKWAGSNRVAHTVEQTKAALDASRAAALANKTVNINQQTTVNVSGVSDPAAAGREVARQQGTVNQGLARSANGAVAG